MKLEPDKGFTIYDLRLDPEVCEALLRGTIDDLRLGPEVSEALLRGTIILQR